MSKHARAVSLFTLLAMSVTQVSAMQSAAVDDASIETQLSSIWWPKNSSYITEEGKAILDDAARRLSEHPTTLLFVDGHAARGETLDIARRRALSVFGYCVNEKGTDPYRLVIRAFGDRYARANDRTDARVELALSSAEKAPLQYRDVPNPIEKSLAARSTVRAAADAKGARAVAQTGHAGTIRSVSYSPDGRFLVTGGDDRTARVWRRSTGDEVRALEGHAAPVVATAWTPDGQLVVTGSLDGTASVWSVATGEEVRRVSDLAGGVSCVDVSTEGRFVALGCRDGSTRIVDLNDGSIVQRFGSTPEAGALSSVAFAEDGKRLLTSALDGSVRVFDVVTGAPLGDLERHDAAVTFASFASRGDAIATASDDGAVRIWNVGTNHVERRIETALPQIFSSSISRDRRWLVASAFRTLSVVRLDGGVAPRSIALGSREFPTALAFDPANSEACVAIENTLRFVGLAKGNISDTIVGRAEEIVVAASGAGDRLVATAGERSTRVLDIAGARETARIVGDKTPSNVAISSDGSMVARVFGGAVSPWDDGPDVMTLQIDKTAGGAAIRRPLAWDREPPVYGRYRLVDDAAPCNLLELQNYGSPVTLQDAATGRCVKSYASRDLDVSPDGTRVVTLHDDNVIVVRDAATGRERVRLTDVATTMDSPFFALGGRLVIAIGSDRIVRAWNAATGRSVWRQPIPERPMSPLEDVDGRADPPMPSADVSIDGSLVVAFDQEWEESSDAFVMRADTGRIVWHKPSSRSLDSVSRDGRFVLEHLIDWDGDDPTRFRVVDAIAKREVWRSDELCQISPDGTRVATYDYDKSVTLRETSTGRVVWSTALRVASVAFSENGRFVLASAGTNGLFWLDGETGRTVARVLHSGDGGWIAVDSTGSRWDGAGRDLSPAIRFVDGVEPAAVADVERRRERGLLARLLGVSAPRAPK